MRLVTPKVNIKATYYLRVQARKDKASIRVIELLDFERNCPPD